MDRWTDTRPGPQNPAVVHLGVSQWDKILNEEICRRTKATEPKPLAISKLKGQWAGHVCRRGDGRESRKVLEAVYK